MYPLVRIRRYAYQGVRNVSFSEIFANVLTEWSQNKLSKTRNYAKMWFKVIWNHISNIFMYFYWSVTVLRGFRVISFWFFLKDLCFPLNLKPTAKVKAVEVLAFSTCDFVILCSLFVWSILCFEVVCIFQHLLWSAVERNSSFISTLFCTDISQVIMYFWNNLMEVMVFVMEVIEVTLEVMISVVVNLFVGKLAWFGLRYIYSICLCLFTVNKTYTWLCTRSVNFLTFFCEFKPLSTNFTK